MLLRFIRFEDAKGRQSTLKERRLVSMGSMRLGALELALTADNWCAGVTVRSAIDGRVVNAGAKLYRKFNNKHLEPLASQVFEQDPVQPITLCVDGEVCDFASGTTRVFRLNEDATDRGAHRDVAGDAP